MTVNVHLDTVLEWRLLAALTDPKFADYIYRVTPALFTNERVKLFDAIKQSHMAYGSVTPESIQIYYGKEAPQEIEVSVVQDIVPIIDRLHTIAIRRQLKEKGQRLQQIADQPTLSLDEVQSTLEFSPLMREESAELADGTQEFLAKYRLKKNRNYEYISTGFDTLDEYLGGEWSVGFTLLGGLPGTGKSALVTQSQLEMAIQHNIASMQINLEMEKGAIIKRMAANIANIPSDDITIAALTDEEEARLERAINQINSLPIKILCNSDMDVTRIVGYIKEYSQKGIKVFFVDHLQLIQSSNDNRNNALGDIAWALKIAAHKYQVRIILLTQLTKKDGKYVVRDSGEVESKAEVFFSLFAESADLRRVIKVEFMKNRDGRLGEFPLIFESRYQRFIDNSMVNRAVAAD